MKTENGKVFPHLTRQVVLTDCQHYIGTISLMRHAVGVRATLHQLQRLFDFGGQDVDALLVVAADGDDDVRKSLGRFDEDFVHRLDVGLVVADGLIEAAAALVHIALDDTDEPFVGAGIDKHLQVEDFRQVRVGEDEDALYDDHLRWCDGNGLLPAAARDVRVGWHLDAAARLQLLDVVRQQRPLDGRRMVEVDGLPLLLREHAIVLVISILRDYTHTLLRDGLDDFFHYGGLSRTGPTGNSDH